MKEKVLYYCEYCGTAYADKKKAMECENFHRVPKKIVRNGCDYKPKNVGPGFPFRIRVQDDYGHTCQYVYDGHET